MTIEFNKPDPARRWVAHTNEHRDNWPTGDNGKPLDDVIRWFTDMRDKIPEEYRHTAICDIRTEHRDDYPAVYVRIDYFSPPTEQEIAFQAELDRRKAEYERQEALAKLRDLESRYPDMST